MPRKRNPELLKLTNLNAPTRYRVGAPSRKGETWRMAFVVVLLLSTCAMVADYRGAFRNPWQGVTVYADGLPVGAYDMERKTLVLITPNSNGNADEWQNIETYKRATRIASELYRGE